MQKVFEVSSYIQRVITVPYDYKYHWLWNILWQIEPLELSLLKVTNHLTGYSLQLEKVY